MSTRERAEKGVGAVKGFGLPLGLADGRRHAGLRVKWRRGRRGVGPGPQSPSVRQTPGRVQPPAPEVTLGAPPPCVVVTVRPRLPVASVAVARVGVADGVPVGADVVVLVARPGGPAGVRADDAPLGVRRHSRGGRTGGGPGHPPLTRNDDPRRHKQPSSMRPGPYHLTEHTLTCARPHTFSHVFVFTPTLMSVCPTYTCSPTPCTPRPTHRHSYTTHIYVCTPRTYRNMDIRTHGPVYTFHVRVRMYTCIQMYSNTHTHS